MRESEVIFDWNTQEREGPWRARPVELDDETLRDGIQSPSAIDPPIEKKVRLLNLMNALGITTCNIGLPGAGARARADVERLAREIAENKLRIQANCAARTVVADVKPVVEVAQKTGLDIEVYTFIGSSPIRQYAEEWDVDTILRRSEEAITFAVKERLRVSYVTEDTTRSAPATLDRLFRHVISLGAQRLTLCDTVGHATPEGTRNLIRWTRGLVRGIGEDVKIDYHNHNDRGLALANALAAAEAGADRLHGCAGGIGERVGNTAMDVLLVNLKLLGAWPHDLSKLREYVMLASEATGYSLPVNYPVMGRDAFRTATGVHASAIIKALKKDDRWLADRVYSGVPAGDFGREQEIEIGPMSGHSNVEFWLKRRSIPYDAELGKAILARAKESDRTLTEAEVLAVAQARAAS
jgi:2-isopropylmalate synthase